MFKAGDIRDRGGYDYRTLRYVIERRLVPGLTATGTGNHRDYAPKQAFLVALACELHEGGVRGDIVTDLTSRVAEEDAWLLPSGETLAFTYGLAIKIEICPAAIRTKLRIDDHGHDDCSTGSTA